MRWFLFFSLMGCSTVFKKAQWNPEGFFPSACGRYLQQYDGPIVKTWVKKHWFRLYQHPNAPETCPGPGNPMIGVQLKEAQAWVVVIESSFSRDDKAPTPASFVAKGENSEEGVPFYRLGSHLGLNPRWQEDQKRLQQAGLSQYYWRAYAFAVRLNGRRVIPLGGVQFGMTKNVHDPLSRMLPLEEVPFKEWERFHGQMERQFPNYVFVTDVFKVL